ncbi:MAG: LLM class flavin-dependent oxidoreductase [Betaproteobacteria bacterium]|nr:LLM class flavin-dependent oxidoreductase [Betaproteobacteria bacterium]
MHRGWEPASAVSYVGRQQRVAPATAVREMIDLCRRFWAGESVDHQGKHAFAKGAGSAYRPATSRYTSPAAARIPSPRRRRTRRRRDHRALRRRPASASPATHRRRPPAPRAKRARPELALWAYTLGLPRRRRGALPPIKPAIGRTIARRRRAWTSCSCGRPHCWPRLENSVMRARPNTTPRCAGPSRTTDDASHRSPGTPEAVGASTLPSATAASNT